jgi:hypothetical protein
VARPWRVDRPARAHLCNNLALPPFSPHATPHLGRRDVAQLRLFAGLALGAGVDDVDRQVLHHGCLAFFCAQNQKEKKLMSIDKRSSLQDRAALQTGLAR